MKDCGMELVHCKISLDVAVYTLRIISHVTRFASDLVVCMCVYVHTYVCTYYFSKSQMCSKCYYVNLNEMFRNIWLFLLGAISEPKCYPLSEENSPQRKIEDLLLHCMVVNYFCSPLTEIWQLDIVKEDRFESSFRWFHCKLTAFKIVRFQTCYRDPDRTRNEERRNVRSSFVCKRSNCNITFPNQ
jgi:hypothetical protein